MQDTAPPRRSASWRHQVRSPARVRHRDLRGARQCLRPRRDHVDARRRAELCPSPAQDHAGADPDAARRYLSRPTTPRSPSCRRSHDAARSRSLRSALAVALVCLRRAARRRRHRRRHPHPPRQWHDHARAREPGGARGGGLAHGQDGHPLGDAPDGGISNFLQIMMVRGHRRRATARRSSRPPTAWAAASRRTATRTSPRSPPPRSTATGRRCSTWSPRSRSRRPCPTARCRPCATSSCGRSAIAAEKPFVVALDTLLARTFGDNPYAWDPIGLKDSLERIDRAALIAHYRRHYVPGGMVLAVSGKVKAAEVAGRAERLFGVVPRARCPPPSRAAARALGVARRPEGSGRPGADLHGRSGAGR